MKKREKSVERSPSPCPVPSLYLAHNFPASMVESQRDSGLKPKVASHELPWENEEKSSNPKAGCSFLNWLVSVSACDVFRTSPFRAISPVSRAPPNVAPTFLSASSTVSRPPIPATPPRPHKLQDLEHTRGTRTSILPLLGERAGVGERSRSPGHEAGSLPEPSNSGCIPGKAAGFSKD